MFIFLTQLVFAESKDFTFSESTGKLICQSIQGGHIWCSFWHIIMPLVQPIGVEPRMLMLQIFQHVNYHSLSRSTN